MKNKIEKKLKEIDAYKVDQTFNTSGDGNKKQLGSLVGGLFTLVLIIIGASYFVSSLIRMHQGKDDVQTDRSRPNSLLDGENIINITDLTFLPSLELMTY